MSNNPTAFYVAHINLSNTKLHVRERDNMSALPFLHKTVFEYVILGGTGFTIEITQRVFQVNTYMFIGFVQCVSEK